ncbi:MAG: hypothetical protein PHP01_09805 [Phycisphaerae bacterium]|nr:hypothetical protein [Phycisphaerae bacterium]
MVLEPSTDWKKVEISVPSVDTYTNELNGLISFSFGPEVAISFTYVTQANPQQNDDCIYVALDKVDYFPSGATECEGNPCPSEKIEKKLQEVNEIVDGKSVQNADCGPSLKDGSPNPDFPACESAVKKEGIRDVVEGKYNPSDNKTEIEQIGVKSLISELIPSIYKDLSLVRETMKTCFYEPGGSSVAQSCELVRNEVGPDGKLIKNCCYKECYMQDCLASCYLKKDRKDYKSCLFSCLSEKQTEEDRSAANSKSFGIQGIDSCRDSLNFYCCTIPKQ